MSAVIITTGRRQWSGLEAWGGGDTWFSEHVAEAHAFVSTGGAAKMPEGTYDPVRGHGDKRVAVSHPLITAAVDDRCRLHLTPSLPHPRT